MMRCIIPTTQVIFQTMERFLYMGLIGIGKEENARQTFIRYGLRERDSACLDVLKRCCARWSIPGRAETLLLRRQIRALGLRIALSAIRIMRAVA